MPPKPKITREMILKAVLNITRRTGFEAVNARSIAHELQCSTRPIFTCYENMEELKKEFLDYAYDFYSRYAEHYSQTAGGNPCLSLPLSYIAFASEETFLFKLLFVTDMDLDMRDANDFYTEIGNEQKAETFSEMIGVDLETAKRIFLDLFLYSHGIAVLTASGKLALQRDKIEDMVQRFLSALINQEHAEKVC